SAGVLTTRRGGVNLHEELQRYLRFLDVAQVESAEKHGHVIPIRPRSGALAKGRVFLVGDAAGLADPVTAEGISYAIRSRQLAAEAILTQRSIADAATGYQASLNPEILSELKAARMLATVLYRWPRLRNLGFR